MTRRRALPPPSSPAGVLALVLLLGMLVLSAAEGQVGTACIDCTTYDVAVTPDGSTVAAKPINSSSSQNFTVRNTGNNSGDTFTLSCTGLSGVTCTSVSPATVTLAANATATARAFYTTGPTVGTGRLNVAAMSPAHDEAWDQGHVFIPLVSNAPVVSLAPHSPAARDVAGCVGACFAKVWSHSTPEFFGRDAYSLTLVYHSGRARPMSTIQLDVSPGGTGATPTQYQVEVRRASDNTLITLMNGATSVFYTAGTGTRRLVAAFDRRLNNLVTRDVAVTVTVTAHFATGSPSTATVSTTTVAVDRSQGVFGAGFWPAGLQQYFATSAGKLVAEGEGAAFLFVNDAVPGGTSTPVTTSAPTWVRRTYSDGSYVEFDFSTGYPRKSVDRFGSTTNYWWTSNRLDSIGVSFTQLFRLGYDANGRLATVTDPAGRITRYTVNAQNRLTRIEDPDGRATTLTYDADDLLVGVTARNGAQWRTGYDPLNQIAADSAPAVQIYTGVSKRPVVQYASELTAAWQPAIAGTSLASSKGAVQGDTLMARVTAPRGGVTRYARDRFGLPTRVVNHYGATTTIVRDTMGRATSITEPNAHVTTRTFSGYRLTQVKDVTTGRVINYTYNARNDLTTESGDVTRRDFHYYSGEPGGPAGALKQIYVGNTAAYPNVSASAVSLGISSAFSDGRLSLIKDGANHLTHYEYFGPTGKGALTEVRDPKGNVTKWYYDAAGRLDSTKVPSSGTFIHTHGVMNQKLTDRNPLGQQVTYGYDAATLDVVRITDAKGQVYKFAYNSLGLLSARHDLADTTKADSLWYDEEGNVRKVKTRRGHVVTLDWDLVGRLLTRTAPGLPVDSFRYANNGRWMVAANANAYDSLAYDQAGRLVFQREKVGNLSAVWATTYDDHDRVVTRQLTSYAPTGYQSYSGYKYHSITGVLDTVCTSAATCVETVLDPELLPATTKYYEPGGPAGSTWTWSQGFDASHRVLSRSFSPSALNTQFGVSVGRDSLNRVRFRTAVSGQKPIRLFRYDKLHRLMNSCDSTAGVATCTNEYGLSGTNAYAYDAAGNRVDPDAPGPVSIGAGNRLSQFKDKTFAHDAGGNITSKSGLGFTETYTWDALGRLARADWDGGLSASFAYDAFGRRISKTTTAGTQRYVHDGDRVVMDVDAAGNVTNEYFHDPKTGDLLMIRNTAWVDSWYRAVAITDPELGTLRGLAKFTGGAMIKRYTENPWGVAVQDTGLAVRFRMAGQEYDWETGLYYMRARYYDPKLGRFLSEDPLGVAGGLNLYAYANNDPVNWSDPSGLDPCPEGGDKKKTNCGSGDGDGDNAYHLPELSVTVPQTGGASPPIYLPLPGRCTSYPTIGPGRGLGGGRGGSSTPVRDAVTTYIRNLRNPACAHATLVAGVSTAGDVTFVGAGLKALTNGLRGISFLSQAMRASGKASGELVNASVKRFDAARYFTNVAGIGYLMDLQLFHPLAGASGFHPADLAPISGSIRAMGTAADACMP